MDKSDSKEFNTLIVVGKNGYQLWWLAAKFLGIDLLYDKVGWQK